MLCCFYITFTVFVGGDLYRSVLGRYRAGVIFRCISERGVNMLTEFSQKFSKQAVNTCVFD